MNKVPNIISTKDLSYLSDIFEWNFTAYKKANHFSNEVTIEDIKKELMIVSSMHKDICDKIVDILK